MKTDTIRAIFFSPTGTSRAITRAVSGGIGKIIDLNITHKVPEPTEFSDQDWAVVGMPVYSGRLPQTAVERFQSLKGNETPVVVLVVYGNRAYEDALAELCDLCAGQGFKVIAAAAFVGQHSFSSKEHPIALGRPDRQDLDLAGQFGIQVNRLLENGTFLDFETVPGNRPYKRVPQPDAAATASNPATCRQCGACVANCPAQAIEMADGMPQTWQDDCIWCMACVQSCPTGARKIVLPKIHESTQRLYENCQPRRDPELFPPLEK